MWTASRRHCPSFSGTRRLARLARPRAVDRKQKSGRGEKQIRERGRGTKTRMNKQRQGEKQEPSTAQSRLVAALCLILRCVLRLLSIRRRDGISERGRTYG